MKAMAIFAGITAVIVLVGGWVFGLAYDTPEAQRAVWVSAVVAFVVQLLAFAVVRATVGTNVVAGWGLGSLVRLLVLAVYALVIVRAFGLPLSPALISLATFFFISMLIEPLLLTV